MPKKENLPEDNNQIPLDDLNYTSPDKKYSFQFTHIEKGFFLLVSKGYADDNAIKVQIDAGDQVRTRLSQWFPDLPFHLIWDLSEFRGASILARYKMMHLAALKGKFGSISAVGANNLAKTYIKIVSTLSPHIKFYFYTSIDEAIQNKLKIFNKIPLEEKINYFITPETNSHARFIDLWQKKKRYLEIDNLKLKLVQEESWKYKSLENNFTIILSILESNVIVIKCEGYIRAFNIEKTYSILKEIIILFGFNNSTNKFYTILDLKKVKSISLNARKLTNYYENMYKDRAHMVIMLPSPILQFALKVQKKINHSTFRHWVECANIKEALTIINKHKEGQYSITNSPDTGIADNIFIPEDKNELIYLVKSLYNENQKLKLGQNDHIQKILEITGRMTWDESFSKKLEFSPEDSEPFTDVYNALSVIHDDFHDILKEKLVHTQKLRESEDKYWNLINLASDIIVVYQDNVCKVVNSRVIEVMGYSPEEIKSLPPQKLMPLKELARIKVITKNLSANTPSYFETYVINKEGKEIPVSVSLGSITFEDKPARMYIVRDITAKTMAEAELDKYRNKLEAMVAERTKQLEKEIIERETAEKSDRLKSAFLSNMSHEIRTPMNAIIAFSNFLRNRDISHAQREEYINYIQSSGQSLLNLINDIIDISKIEAKQINIQKVNCAVYPILEELYTLFEDTRKNKGCAGLQIFIKKVEYEDLVINTDPYRLKQILSNLLHNALKFTEKGSIEFGYTLKENVIEFFVKDTGIGIPEDKIEYIFQRFGKLQSIGRNRGGTGLGLTISQNLAKLLNGRLSVESIPGQGSTFYLTIPYNDDQQTIVIAQNMEYVEKKVYNWINKKILVAEDEDLNYKVFQIALQKTNAKILRANDGHEAVEAVLTNPDINIILMDIQMPHMDGYEALTKIKQINSNLPVIAQTAFAMIEEKDSCLKFGFNDYISKPIKFNELLMKIDKYMI